MISESLPYWPINPSLVTNNQGPWYVFQLDIVRALWAVLPATLLWGASFPLALAAVASPGQEPGRMVGRVYAANTVGAIVGALVFSMLVIPQFGTQSAERLLMVLAMISALIVLWPPSPATDKADKPAGKGSPQPGLSTAGFVAVLLSVVLVALLVRAVSQVPWVMVAWGRFSATRMSESAPGIVAESQVPGSGNYGRYCTYVGEGTNVSVAVTKSSAGWLYFHGAGKVQASTEPEDMRLQRMLGHLSVLAHQNPDQVKDVLVVACGAGVTAGSFVPYPNIKSILICDIEPLVPKVVTPMFGDVNYHVVDGIDRQNPHIVNGKEVKVVYDDGRHHISTLPKDVKYDVITSDPIDPWVKGCAALNTIEYYQMCKAHLKPGGVMSLWMPLYESNPETTRSVIATFFEVFPNGIFFSNEMNGEGYDAVLLGRAEPTTIDVDAVGRHLARPEYQAVRNSLAEVGFGGSASGPMGVALDLLATYAGRASDMKEWMRGAQINYDRNLRLQYLAGLSLNQYVGKQILDEILMHYRFPDELFVGSAEGVAAMKQALRATGRPTP